LNPELETRMGTEIENEFVLLSLTLA